MRIVRVHHVTVAVRNIDEARETFARLFDATVSDVGELPAFGALAADVTLDGALLQLVSPLEFDSALQRFLERRGEGVYSVALEVEDLDAALDALAEKGVRVSEPVEVTPGVRSAFVSMAAAHGVSLQLIEHGRAGAPDEGAAPGATEAPAPKPARPRRKVDLRPDDEPDDWSDMQ